MFTLCSSGAAVESILSNEPVMADQIVITEKTSQAKDVRAAVGSRYGHILPAEGHLLDLLEPEDVVPAWKRWSPILLRPEGLYGTRPAYSRCGTRRRTGLFGASLLRKLSDLLEIDGEDFRPQPLHARKTRLEKLLAKASAGIQFNEHVKGDGQIVFEHACKLGLEGIVSKHHPYRSGRSKSWLKIKNPAAPGVLRFEKDAQADESEKNSIAFTGEKRINESGSHKSCFV
jgi:hypothetical protein